MTYPLSLQLITQAILGSDARSVLSVIFGLLATIGAGLAAIALGTIKTLRESNADLRERDGDREKRIVELETKVTELTTANKVLAAGVRNDEKVEALTAATKEFTKVLGSHHDEAKVHWSTEEALLRGLVDELTGGGKR